MWSSGSSGMVRRSPPSTVRSATSSAPASANRPSIPPAGHDRGRRLPLFPDALRPPRPGSSSSRSGRRAVRIGSGRGLHGGAGEAPTRAGSTPFGGARIRPREGRPTRFSGRRGGASGRRHPPGARPRAGSTPFFEGDDRADIDGELAILGTGSEDSSTAAGTTCRGAGNADVAPAQRLPRLQEAPGPDGRLPPLDHRRLRLQDIDFTIEHGPEGTPFRRTTRASSSSIPRTAAGDEPLPPAAGAGWGLDRIVFVPGWNVPIHSISLQDAVWTKTSRLWARTASAFLDEDEREDVFGPTMSRSSATFPRPGDTGSVKAVLGPDQGILRVFERDRPAGEAVNLYAAERAVGAPLALGVFEMRGGRTSSTCISRAPIPIQRNGIRPRGDWSSRG